MQRTRVSAAVAGAIVLAAVFVVPPSGPGAEPAATAPLTPIHAASERLPIGSPFVAVPAAEVLRASHSAPAAPAAASVTVSRATTFVAAVPSGPQGIPVPVLDAYKHAADMVARSDAACHLDWTLLAGIGRIESSHAYGGRVDENGNTRGKILGPRLDGSLPGTAVITDSDGGEMDDDA
ncbi:MAG: lytic transglycosylase domain-containing protein, partial [Actinomycetes bacterium]